MSCVTLQVVSLTVAEVWVAVQRCGKRKRMRMRKNVDVAADKLLILSRK